MSIRRELRGRRPGTKKLTEADVREIRRRLGAGETAVQVAPDFGVSPTQVRTIRRREQWGWVD